MKYIKTFLTVLGIIALFYFMAPKMLYGYLDAGTGSYMIQIVIAALAGGALAIKLSWRRIYSFFKRVPSRSRKDEKDKV